MNKRELFVAWGFLICGAIGISETMVRLFLDPPDLLPRGGSAKLMMPHPVRGYTLAPGTSDEITAGGRLHMVRINDQGFRSGPFGDAVKSEIRMLAAGDSFTLGLGVDSMDPWPQQLEGLLRRDLGHRASVLDAGVPGYSARQMRQMVEEVAPRLRPQVVLYGAYVRTYWRVDAPYVLISGYLVKTADAPDLVLGRGGILYSPITRWPWLNRIDVWLNLNFELGAHLLSITRRMGDRFLAGHSGQPVPAESKAVDMAEAEKRLTPMLRQIEETDEFVRANGMALVVLLINPQEQDGSFAPAEYEYNRVVRQFCLERHIRLVDPLPALVKAAGGQPVFTTPDNGHWTREAHRLVAEELYGYLRGEGIIGGATVGPPLKSRTGGQED